MSRVKIAYISSSNPFDKKSWSGIHYHLFNSLIREGFEVEALGPYQPSKLIIFLKIKAFLNHKFFGKRIDHRHSIILSKNYASYFEKKLKEKKYDIIFAPVAATEVAFLRTDLPIITFSDTTYPNMVNYYESYSKLTKNSLKEATEIERKFLTKATAVIYPSQWAADSAMKEFGIDEQKISIVPMGANIESIPDASVVQQKAIDNTCDLLFLGVDWERKGGELAFEAFEALTKKGVNTTLTVCGCVPPAQFAHERLQVIPYLDKNKPEHRQQFNEILLRSDFLILPSRAECFGVVFCEASAFGIPSITSDTGGIEGAVKNGINGYRLPIDATKNDYADKIEGIFSNKEALKQLQQSSREFYETTLNWQQWGSSMKKIINKLLP